MSLRNVVVCCGLVTLALNGCGKTSKKSSGPSKQEQADKFFEEKLKLSQQKICNDKGLFYENGAADCSVAKLATWECTRAGIETKIAGRNSTLTEAVMKAFDTNVEQGLKAEQCGEDDKGTVYVMLVKKEITSSEAKIAKKLLEIPNI